jgi:hypothetical protein
MPIDASLRFWRIFNHSWRLAHMNDLFHIQIKFTDVQTRKYTGRAVLQPLKIIYDYFMPIGG